VNETEISALVTRLSRPYPAGGVVIERAAILAAGADYPAVMDWIFAHSGAAEVAVPAAANRGLHGSRLTGGGTTASQKPLRFVLPVDAFN
jgi:hypothetical protein